MNTVQQNTKTDQIDFVGIKPFEEYTSKEQRELYLRIREDLENNRFYSIEDAFAKIRQGVYAGV